MSTDDKEYYKETTQEEIVEKLICILNEIGIEVQETLMEDSEIW